MKRFILLFFLSIVFVNVNAQDTIDYQVSARPKIKATEVSARLNEKEPEINYERLKSYAIRSAYLRENNKLNLFPIYRLFKPEELENKVIVLIFWSADCTDCTNNFSNLSSILKKYKNNKDLVVMAITKDPNTVATEKLAEKPLLYAEFIHNATTLVNKYQVDQLPAYIIADKSHSIRYSASGTADIVLPAFKKVLETAMTEK